MITYILIVNQGVLLIRFPDMLTNLTEWEFTKPASSVGKGKRTN